MILKRAKGETERAHTDFQDLIFPISFCEKIMLSYPSAFQLKLSKSFHWRQLISILLFGYSMCSKSIMLTTASQIKHMLNDADKCKLIYLHFSKVLEHFCPNLTFSFYIFGLHAYAMLFLGLTVIKCLF